MRLTIITAIVMLSAVGMGYADTDSAKSVDTRLDQKITYQAKGLTLHKALEELTEKTGVTMTAGMNAKDWQVRDRKVCMSVKDMPLGDFQKTLAKLLRFTWARGEKNGVYTYRIFQDLKSRKEEDALLGGDADARAKRISDARLSAMDQIDKLSSMSPDEIAKLKKDSPFLYLMAKEPIGKALSDVMHSIPTARDSFAAGRDLSLPVSKLSQEGVNATESLVTGIDSLMQKIMPFSQTHTGLLNSLSSAQVRLRFPGAEMPQEMSDRGFLGMIEVKADGSDPVGIPLLDPSSPMANMMAKVAIRAMDGESMDKVGADMQAESRRIMLGQDDSKDKEEELPKDDPALDKKIKLDVTKPEMPEVIAALGKKSDIDVVSDYFVERWRPAPKTEGTLREVLKSIAESYGKRVKKVGDVITFEDRKWYEKRSWEVPESWMEQWKASAKAGTLGFDGIVSISCLTDAQITHTIMTDDTLPSVIGFGIYQQRQLLRLYAVLTPDQKSAIAGKSGLDASAMTQDQWSYLVAAEPSAGDKSAAGSRLVLFLESDQHSGARTFRLEESTQNQDGTWLDPPHQVKGWLIPAPIKPAAKPASKPETKWAGG